MQTIRPINDQIFAQPSEPPKKTASGLLIADVAEKPTTARVLNTGPEVKSVKQNDVITYKSYTTTEIKLNNTDFILVKEEDVLGVVVETS